MEPCGKMVETNPNDLTDEGHFINSSRRRLVRNQLLQRFGVVRLLTMFHPQTPSKS